MVNKLRAAKHGGPVMSSFSLISNRSSYHEGGRSDGGVSNLTVGLRVRPLSTREKKKGATQVIYKVDEQMVVMMDPADKLNEFLRANRSREKKFLFDHAFGPESTQEEVYTAMAYDLVDTVLDGFNCTVFAYGATGAGKTHTMLGSDEQPGIMGLALRDLFSLMHEREDDKFAITMSYLEIYNEMIRDLLKPSSKVLELREDSKGNVQIAGLSQTKAKTAAEVIKLLLLGNERRTQEPTDANLTSSRSHAVLQVNIVKKSKARGVTDSVGHSKLFLVDLAGSERAANTKNRGQRLKEGAHINRSLLALGNVINGLTEKNLKYVNYRDSKLTRLLKDSLGGNSRTVMIAHVSPSSLAFEESRTTLTYADRAKNITTKMSANTEDVSQHVSQYQSIISELRKEIVRLKGKIDEQSSSLRVASRQSRRSPSDVSLGGCGQSIISELRKEIVRLKGKIDEQSSSLRVASRQSRRSPSDVSLGGCGQSIISELRKEIVRLKGKIDEQSSSLRVASRQSRRSPSDVSLGGCGQSIISELRKEIVRLKGKIDEQSSSLRVASRQSRRSPSDVSLGGCGQSIISELRKEIVRLKGKIDEQSSSLRVASRQSRRSPSDVSLGGCGQSIISELRKEIVRLKGKIDEQSSSLRVASRQSRRSPSDVSLGGCGQSIISELRKEIVRLKGKIDEQSSSLRVASRQSRRSPSDVSLGGCGQSIISELRKEIVRLKGKIDEQSSSLRVASRQSRRSPSDVSLGGCGQSIISELRKEIVRLKGKIDEQSSSLRVASRQSRRSPSDVSLGGCGQSIISELRKEIVRLKGKIDEQSSSLRVASRQSRRSPSDVSLGGCSQSIIKVLFQVLSDIPNQLGSINCSVSDQRVEGVYGGARNSEIPGSSTPG